MRSWEGKGLLRTDTDDTSASFLCLVKKTRWYRKAKVKVKAKVEG